VKLIVPGDRGKAGTRFSRRERVRCGAEFSWGFPSLGFWILVRFTVGGYGCEARSCVKDAGEVVTFWISGNVS